MLLVLYMEYLMRCKEPPSVSNPFSYSEWLDILRGDAEESGVSLGEAIRQGIDSTYVG